MMNNILNSIMDGEKKPNKKPRSNVISTIMNGESRPKKSKKNILGDVMNGQSKKTDMGFIKDMVSTKTNALSAVKPTKDTSKLKDFAYKKKKTPALDMKIQDPRKVNQLVMGNKNTIVNDRGKTKKQKKYLKENKGVKRFLDSDGDFVPNGLDCSPMDPDKHGLWSKTKSWLKGKGFREPEKVKEEEKQEKMQELEKKYPPEKREMEQKKAEGIEKEIDEKLEQRAKEMEKEPSKYKEASEEAKEGEQRIEQATPMTEEYEQEKQKIEEEFKPKPKKKTPLGRRIGSGIGDWMQKKGAYKVEGEQEKTKKVPYVKGRVPKYNDKGEQVGYKEVELKKSEKKPKNFEKLDEFEKEVPTGEKEFKKTPSFSRGISKAFGYIFEEPEKRKLMQKEDYADRVKKARETLPFERVSKITKNQNLTQEEKEAQLIKEANEYLEKKQKQKEKERKLKPLEEQQRRRQMAYESFLTQQSYSNIDALKRRQGESYGGVNLTGFMIGSGKPTTGTLQTGTGYNSNQLQNFMIQPYRSDQPKFAYERDVGSFTRKSSYLPSGEEPMPGEEVQPSMKKRSGKMYPSTKPMPGYKRVFKGYGKPGGRGRKPKRSMKKDYTQEEVEKPKKQYSPFVRTYGEDALRR